MKTFDIIIRPPTSYGHDGGDTDVIVVHDLVNSTYPFVVKSDGTLRCTKAEIKGNVKADSGYIGKCSLSDGYLSSDYTLDGRQYSVNLTNQGAIIIGYTTPRIGEWFDIITAAQYHSDMRLKTNISQFDEKFELFFDGLQSVHFQYNNLANVGDIDVIHFGFIAQDVVRLLDQAGINNFGGVWKSEYYKLDTREFIALNTWQIQKAKARIAELEEKTTSLESKLAELEEKINKLING